MADRRGNLWRNDSGAIAASYAVALLGLIAVAGVGYDYTRLAGLDSELQNAADQAALAAATQLDKTAGACARSSTAAVSLLRNVTLLANDGNAAGNQITVTGETACDATGMIRFYQDKAKTTPATSDATARFVEVHVNPRRAFYALTPVMAAFRDSGDLRARAFAGVGSAICRVPPLMICSPTDDPTIPFNGDSKRGMGIKATASGGNTWAPGAFGFLEVGTGQLADLAEALAFDQTEFDCAPIDEGTDPETGNAQVLYEAVNTRFDIRPNGGGVLSPCQDGACPAALNVTKDLVKANTNTGGNSCRIHNSGWQLPAVGRRFRPRAYVAGDSSASTFDADGIVDAIGLGRDMCHYTSYGRNCTLENGGLNDRFGDGKWAIRDYFAKNHGTLPPNDDMTRYEVYQWELANTLPGTTGGQRSSPLCVPGTSDIDRRVLTIAVVKNCAALRGGSRTVEIDEWVDMFMVEPVVDDTTEKNNGRDADMIYLEVIGAARLGGGVGSVTTQAIRKDVPYLIE